MPSTDTRAALEQIDRALDMVSALCKPRGTAGAREWIMSIPARPDSDPDIVIADALHAARRLLSAHSAPEERAALDRERNVAQQIADDIVWADRELRGRIGPQDRRLLRLREHAAKLMQFSRSAPEERGEGEIMDRLFRAAWDWEGGGKDGVPFEEAGPYDRAYMASGVVRAYNLFERAGLLASPPAPVERCVCSWCGVEVAETNEENACPLCVRHYGLTPPHAEEEHPRSFVTDEVREQAGAPAPVGGTRDHEAWLDFACAINIGKCHGLEMEEAAAQHLEAGMRQIVREEIAALAVRVPLRQSPASDSKYETGATVPVQGERGEEEPGDALFDAPCTCPHCGFVGTIAGPYHDCKDGTRFSSPAPVQEPEPPDSGSVDLRRTVAAVAHELEHGPASEGERERLRELQDFALSVATSDCTIPTLIRLHARRVSGLDVAPEGSPAADRAAWLAEYEQRKAALTEAVWRCSEWYDRDNQFEREQRGREQDRAERALDEWVESGAPALAAGLDRAAAVEKIDAALAMVHALCQPRGTAGAREWLMSIPADPERDPDLVIADALHASRKALAALPVQGEPERPELDLLIRVACGLADRAPWRQSVDMDLLKDVVGKYRAALRGEKEG